jgi:hypothetical protein
VQASEQAVRDGRTTVVQHEKLFYLQNLKIADVSFAISSLGAVLALAIGAGIIVAVNGDVNFIRGYAAMMLFTAMIWLVFSFPWFFLEQRRPGRKLPPGTNYFTVLSKAVWEGMRCAWQLKQVSLVCPNVHTDAVG